MVMDGQLGSFKSSGEIGGKRKEKKNNNVKSKMMEARCRGRGWRKDHHWQSGQRPLSDGRTKFEISRRNLNLC